jgi:hypothetical protein
MSCQQSWRGVPGYCWPAVCYQWAVSNSGVDPFNAQAAQQRSATQTTQTQRATQQQIDGFKKAFSACLEGKHYIAKF